MKFVGRSHKLRTKVTLTTDIHPTQNKPYAYLGTQFITLFSDVGLWNITMMLGVIYEFESIGAIFKDLIVILRWLANIPHLNTE